VGWERRLYGALVDGEVVCDGFMGVGSSCSCGCRKF